MTNSSLVLAFDLGRVIFDFDYSIAISRLEGRIKVPGRVILEQLYSNRFGLNFEKGLVSSHEFYDEFRRDFDARVDYDDFKRIWSQIFFPKEDMISLLEALKDRYPLYLISNINELHFEYLEENFPAVFKLFNALILSYKVKSVKPEDAIYQELSKVSGAKFEDIVYIDDRQDLIEPARRFHMHCLQFYNLQRLLPEFKKLGIEPMIHI